MKVKSALKKFCKHCFFQTRGKKIYVRCPANPRHKQRQGFCTIKHNCVNEAENPIDDLYFQKLWFETKLKDMNASPQDTPTTIDKSKLFSQNNIKLILSSRIIENEEREYLVSLKRPQKICGWVKLSLLKSNLRLSNLVTAYENKKKFFQRQSKKLGEYRKANKEFIEAKQKAIQIKEEENEKAWSIILDKHKEQRKKSLAEILKKTSEEKKAKELARQEKRKRIVKKKKKNCLLLLDEDGEPKEIPFEKPKRKPKKEIALNHKKKIKGELEKARLFDIMNQVVFSNQEETGSVSNNKEYVNINEVVDILNESHYLNSPNVPIKKAEEKIDPLLDKKLAGLCVITQKFLNTGEGEGEGEAEVEAKNKALSSDASQWDCDEEVNEANKENILLKPNLKCNFTEMQKDVSEPQVEIPTPNKEQELEKPTLNVVPENEIINVLEEAKTSSGEGTQDFVEEIIITERPKDNDESVNKITEESNNQGILKTKKFKKKLKISTKIEEKTNKTSEKTKRIKLTKHIPMGNFADGDNPKRVISGYREDKNIFFDIEWKRRRDGVKPLESRMSSISLRKYNPDFLFNYYESLIVFKSPGKN